MTPLRIEAKNIQPRLKVKVRNIEASEAQAGTHLKINITACIIHLEGEIKWR